MEAGYPPSTGGNLFPPSERVIYRNAPLTEVIAQVRFPPLLRIEAEIPAEFQERIRGVFPLLEKGAPTFALPEGASAQLPPEMLQLLAGGAPGGTVSYRFLTEDRNSTVILTPDALTLSTKSYTRWEEFFENFRLPLDMLISKYEPSFITRVGLRYVNAIEKTPLGFSAETPWSALLNREILGELALPAFERNLIGAARQLQANLPDKTGHLLFRHGVRALPNHTELAYMLDFDFVAGNRTEAADAEHRLTSFHRLAGDAFRWCIQTPLHDALGPIPVADPKPD